MSAVFQILTEEKATKARLGRLNTLHGPITTPAFVPDATYGAVKHLSSQDLKKINLQIVLGNIYHLGLRPGTKIINKLGGLHQFMNWNKPIITDSGGWQVFSLVYKNKMGKVKNTGIEFKDHLSGTKHFLTPSKSIKQQLKADADILMVLDYPVLGKASAADNNRSVKLTTSWAKTSLKAFQKLNNKKDRIILAIIQGADSSKMRKKSYQQLSTLYNWPGYGFGGPPTNKKILKYTASLIPKSKIRYLMGGDSPLELIKAVSYGWDLFDCVIPTRNARHGLLYTFSGEIRINQEKYKLDKKPIEKNCPCQACQLYSRAYLRHLFKVNEPLAPRLFSLHNLCFYLRLMEKIRSSIKNGDFSNLYKNIQKFY
jgi:queuine tRNA-ribosyltransferase